VGRYRIVRTVGRGGMGTVYEAFDDALGRSVAIKVLTPVDPAYLFAEARALAQLSHPNVVAVFDVGRLDSEHVFIAMELVRGPTLARWLANEERSVGEVLAVMMEAGRGLAAAHAAGLAHGDFKPTNVLIGDDGRVRVADFGLARSVLDEGATAVAGTLGYMAPEQLLRLPTTPASDQFAFCVTLHEAVCGARPFDGNHVETVVAAIAGGLDATRDSGLPDTLRPLISRGLASSPAARHESMVALLAELERERERLELTPLRADEPSFAPQLSVGILPFDTPSDVEDRSIGAGFKDDLLTALSRLPGLFVVVRSPASGAPTVKQRSHQPHGGAGRESGGSGVGPSPVSKPSAGIASAVMPADLGRSSGERFLLGGSLRRTKEGVRVSARLIDTASATCTWSEEFQSVLTDVLALQDELARAVAAALSVHLGLGETPRVRDPGAQDPRAWDFFVRGRDLLARPSPASVGEASRLLDHSLELAPRFAVAVAWRAYAHLVPHVNGWPAPDGCLSLAEEWAARALDLDDKEPDVHFVAGTVALWARRLDEAEARAVRAFELSPGHALNANLRGAVLHFSGDSTSALPWMYRAARLERSHPGSFLHQQAVAHFALKNYERAAALEERRLIREPESDVSRAWLAAAYGQLGAYTRATVVWQALVTGSPTFSLRTYARRLPYRNPESVGAVFEGLARAQIDPH
jgi:serine/threonine protein kinase/Flp pilus assembly protein TadD